MNGTRRAWILAIAAGLMVSAGRAADKPAGPSQLADNLAAGKKQTVVTYGTSLTAGGAWVRQLAEALMARYGHIATVINSGAGGMWSKWGVDNLDARVLKKNPDAVLIEFAINDAFLQYKTSVADARANLENMIDRILKHNPACEVVLMTMNPPIGVHLERRPKIQECYQMYRDVARERKLLLIDHYPAWKAILDKEPDRFKKLVPDGIHPSAEGCLTVTTPGIWKALIGGPMPEPAPSPPKTKAPEKGR